MTGDSEVLYVYSCSKCKHRGEQRHADDSHDGEASTCSACGAVVTLEWDGGVTFDAAPLARQTRTSLMPSKPRKNR